MAGSHTTPELVAAVSNAGGLGILGASRLTPQQLKDAINKIKSLTNRIFGVNLLLAPPESGNQGCSYSSTLFGSVSSGAEYTTIN